MNNIKRKCVYFLNILFFCVFLGHILRIGFKLKNPEFPSVKVYKKELKDIEFPITFKLCLLENNRSSERYKRLGYTTSIGFYSGQSMFDGNVVGWNGHTRNTTTLASLKGKVFAIKQALSRFL